MRTNLSFDESMGRRLPKSVGYSGLFRWAMHVAVDTEKEFSAALLNDPGIAAANQYMVAKVLRLFGKG